MAKREILTVDVKRHLDNFTMAIGVKLGKLIKQCIDGAASSGTRSAFNVDFLGAASAAGSITAISAGTPAGTNAVSLVTPLKALSTGMIDKPVIALTHNADPVSGLAATLLWVTEGSNNSIDNLGILQSASTGTVDVLGETADGLAGVAASCRFPVIYDATPTGVQIYVNEAESDRLECVSPTESDCYIIMPFESAAGGISGCAIAVKIYHSAAAATGKALYFDDNGAADAQLAFIDTGATGGVIPAADITVLVPSYSALTASGLGRAAAQVFTGAALTTHTHANTLSDSLSGMSVATTQTAGAPVAALKANAARGILELTLAVNDEVETARADFGDQLCIDIDDAPYIEVLASYTKTAGQAAEAVIGFASASNAALDTITESAWFKIVDSGTAVSLVVESDDGTNNNDDIPSNYTLVDGTNYTFKIDMRDKANVKFFVESLGRTQQVAMGSVFDMSNYSGGLQPYIKIGKASGTSIASLKVDYVRGEMNRE